MKIGINVGYAGADMASVLPLVEHADRIGVHSVWAAESYGTDAVSALSYLAARTERIRLGSAILQMPARTPAMAGMTAMSIDAMSGGRFVLGLGVSGPQVVEGWHGVAYGKPLGRTREYVSILRAIFAREERLTFEGEHYQIPYAGDDATGFGKPLKSIMHPIRNDIPIMLAAIGPKNIELAGEIADGWQPTLYSPEHEAALTDPLDAGLARSGRSSDDVEVVCGVRVAVGDDVAECRDRIRPAIALYVGGMGARGRNFYNNLVQRYGFEQAASEIQDHFLEGRRDEAAAAVPDELVDQLALVGPVGRIVDRLEAWKESRVTELSLVTTDTTVIEAAVEATA